MSPTSSDPALSADAITGRLSAAGCVFAEEEARLLIEAASSPDALRAMVSERGAGVPLEHVVGWAEFFGLRIAIDPGVFVPRRRSARLRRRVSVIAANVPYVPTEAVTLMPPEARVYEPLVALDGGPDGLDVLRRAAVGAAAWLMPGGHLLIETASGQAEIAAAAFAAAGLGATVARDEELGATVVIGRR